MQAYPALPPEHQQPTEYCEQNEGEMYHNDEVCKNAIEHYFIVVGSQRTIWGNIMHRANPNAWSSTKGIIER